VNGQPWAIVIISDREKLDELCAAMTENILFATHSLGLGAVWTAVHPDPSRLESVRRILGVPADIIPLNVIPIGVITGPPVVNKPWQSSQCSRLFEETADIRPA
jgi:nitroreductase